MATTEWRASIDDTLIQKIKEVIVQRFHPERIVLFGSHARGEAGPDSDLDLDLAVFTPEEVAANRDIRGTLLSRKTACGANMAHMILTGGNAYPTIIEVADIVTKMLQGKHAYETGVEAQRGIEYR